MRRRSPWLVLTLALAVHLPLATSPQLAFAADDTAKARATFQEGVQLEAAGNYASALSKFQAVAQVKRTPQVVFHIAFCQEKLGHLVEAMGGYRIAAHEASEDSKMAKVAQTAGDAATSLEKRIPTLVIKRGTNADLAKISIDGQEMAGASLDKPMQLDPGSHQVEATLKDREPFSNVVKLAEGETKTVEIVFKDKKAAVVAGGGDEKKDDKKDPTPPPPPEESHSSVVPYVIGGIGVASLIGSGVFFLMRNGAKSDLDNQCHGDICPTSAQSTQDKGKSMALLGNIFLGVGVVGLGTGIVLLATQKSSPEPAPSAARNKMDVVVSPVTGGMGASLVGSFLSPRPRSAEDPRDRGPYGTSLRLQLPGPHVRRQEVLRRDGGRR